MYASRRNTFIGLLYLAPALLFVAAFTAYPFVQMAYVSLTNWSLIEAPKFVGLENFQRAISDRQFWISLGYTLKSTLIITPTLMLGGYLVALLTAENTPFKRLTRAIVFIPVVIGLGSSSLLWYWLFSPRSGLANKLLQDLGIISQPVLWLGVGAATSPPPVPFPALCKVPR